MKIKCFKKNVHKLCIRVEMFQVFLFIFINIFANKKKKEKKTSV